MSMSPPITYIAFIGRLRPQTSRDPPFPSSRPLPPPRRSFFKKPPDAVPRSFPLSINPRSPPPFHNLRLLWFPFSSIKRSTWWRSRPAICPPLQMTRRLLRCRTISFLRRGQRFSPTSAGKPGRVRPHSSRSMSKKVPPSSSTIASFFSPRRVDILSWPSVLAEGCFFSREVFPLIEVVSPAVAGQADSLETRLTQLASPVRLTSFLRRVAIIPGVVATRSWRSRHLSFFPWRRGGSFFSAMYRPRFSESTRPLPATTSPLHLSAPERKLFPHQTAGRQSSLGWASLGTC